MQTEIVVAIIGIVGVVVGAAIGIAGQFLFHWFQERPKRKLDEARKQLLKTMLNDSNHTWRTFDRLMHVIGADEDTTKRLLLEVGARASEDGQHLWGLVSRNSFDKSQ